MDALQDREGPVITVVMAAYNAEAYVARAVESVRAQTFANWELICIDDGSTDGTQSVIRGFAEIDNRIHLIEQENAGPAAARRKGYVEGSGDYFIMLDSDDWFAPDALERLRTEASQSGADAVSCNAMMPTADGEGWTSFHEMHGTSQGQRFSGHEAFAKTFPWEIHGICLWRRNIIKANATNPDYAFNGFNADEYLTRKLFLACREIVIGSGQYFIFPNPNSLTRNASWRRFLRLETDRRLTDLAFEVGVSPEIIDKVVSSQRAGLLDHVESLTYDGAGGRSFFVSKELWRSILHYRSAARRTGNRQGSYALLGHILGTVARVRANQIRNVPRRIWRKLFART